MTDAVAGGGAGGERGLFIRADELAASWDIFDDVLHATDAGQIEPEPYPTGTSGPPGITPLLARHGIA